MSLLTLMATAFVLSMLLVSYAIFSDRLLHDESNPLATITSYHNHRLLALDPKTLQLKEDLREYTPIIPVNKDELCTARVNDGIIIAESVIDNNGYFDLALPEDYEVTASIECTKYVRTESPPSERSQTIEKYVKNPSMPVRHVSPSPEKCNPTNFHSGYFDLRTSSWHDRCPSRSLADRDSKLPISKDTCPILRNRKEDIWVHFVGDSVGHDWLDSGVIKNIVLDKSIGASFWKTGAWAGRSDTRQIPFAKTDDSDARIWATYRYDGTGHTLTTKFFERWAHTWGDFMNVRGEQARSDKDPNFSEDKVPDFIFWGPGYHSSSMNSGKFGMMVDNMLTLLEENARVVNPPKMPQIYVLLNIMPAPWMIPNKYAGDVEYRTLLNEHRKNLSIIEAVKKHLGSGSCRGVVDVFSVELLFNRKEGEKSAHSDAVHIHGPNSGKVYKAAANRIIDTICLSEGP